MGSLKVAYSDGSPMTMRYSYYLYVKEKIVGVITLKIVLNRIVAILTLYSDAIS